MSTQLTSKPKLIYDFEEGRKELFTKGYTQLQVDSINAIVKEANEQGITVKQQLAYILATAYHEGDDYDGKTTGKIQKLVSIKEKGSESYLRSKSYYPHIGYGFVQLTWLANYKKFQPLIQAKFGVDCVANPNVLLRIDIAAYVIVYGMKHGSYTGKKLSDYITSLRVDFQQARRIVNGTDKMTLIAGYASKFLKCIK